MGVRKVIACLLLALSCGAAGRGTTAREEPQQRDLSRYEQGCAFTLRDLYGTMVDSEEGAKALVRASLWEKWRGRRLGYCAIVTSDSHGDSTTTNYYVEPDKEGRWRVAVETVSSCCSLEVMEAAMAGRKKEREVATLVVGSYYAVGRVDAGSGRPVPENEKRKPETYALLLQDRKPAGKDDMGSPSLKL